MVRGEPSSLQALFHTPQPPCMAGLAGACTYAGAKNERQPSQFELDYARYQVNTRRDGWLGGECGWEGVAA